VCYKGKFIGIEVKRPGETATKLQEHNIANIFVSGGSAIVARDVEDVKAFIEFRSGRLDA